MQDITFAFVTFVNATYPYPDLMEVTLRSHRLFSKVPLILYTYGLEPNTFTECGNTVIEIAIPTEDVLPSVYYYKPYVIKDCIKRGLKAGFYIEADDILAPRCDEVQQFLSRIDTIPLSPIHQSNPDVPDSFMNPLGVYTKTQPYVHGHVLFTDKTLPFIEEWFDACMKSTGHCWDESALNCILWKHRVMDHYLPIIDPHFGDFYEPREEVTRHMNGLIILYDGCKEPRDALWLLERLFTSSSQHNNK
jgi:hypothetical protein